MRERRDGTARIAVDTERRPIVVTEGDIADIASGEGGHRRAGTLTAAGEMRIDAGDITPYVRGRRVRHPLDPDHAVDIGLLPEGLRGASRRLAIRRLAGAYMVAIDRRILDDLARCAHEVEVLELNFDERFESRFIDQLLLP